MPILLADSIAAALSDRTTALAAAFIIGTKHADVLQWVAKTIALSAADLEPQPKPRLKSNGRLPRGGKTPKRTKANGADSRCAKRDADDAALVEAMRVDPAGPLGAWSVAIGKSRTSVVSALHRLKDAGLVANADRTWALVDAPRESTPPWVSPLRGKARAAVAHLNAAS